MFSFVKLHDWVSFISFNFVLKRSWLNSLRHLYRTCIHMITYYIIGVLCIWEETGKRLHYTVDQRFKRLFMSNESTYVSDIICPHISFV